MARVRDSARTYAQCDPIDALAVARAAQREPNLPQAQAHRHPPAIETMNCRNGGGDSG